jgi:uncharacterized membrane protein
MHTTVAREDLADYSSGTPAGDWEDAARLLIGGTLIAFGLVQRSKLGAALAVLGGGIASAGLVPNEQTRRTTAVTPKKRIVRRAITIGKPQAEVYDFWAKPENLQQIFPNVESITPLPDGKWQWKLKFASVELTVDTEAIVSDPPKTMSWKSVQESPVEQAGSVLLQPAPGGKGTEVQLTVSWLAKNAASGMILPMLGKGSAWHASESLRRSKQLLETGELSTAEFAALPMQS